MVIRNASTPCFGASGKCQDTLLDPDFCPAFPASCAPRGGEGLGFRGIAEGRVAVWSSVVLCGWEQPLDAARRKTNPAAVARERMCRRAYLDDAPNAFGGESCSAIARDSTDRGERV
jgi:hypothetical protein